MRKDQPVTYYIMIGLTIIFTLAAIATLFPFPSASKPNILGYRSLCPFAPAATAMCGLLAGLCCTFRNRFVSKSAASNRYGPWIAPFVVVVILGGIGIFAGFRFASVQSEFISIIHSKSTTPTSTLTLQDGMREGEASNGKVSAKVRVKVAANTIIGVELIFGKNVDPSLSAILGKRIIESQTLTVDAVSGATASSQVFLQAVDKALFPLSD